jgi:N-methylhydantoinase B
VKILRNDRIQAITTDGGGFGDPLERDPELVLQDVLNELGSLESAGISTKW